MECMMVWCPDRETGIGSSKLDMEVTGNELIKYSYVINIHFNYAATPRKLRCSWHAVSTMHITGQQSADENRISTAIKHSHIYIHLAKQTDSHTNM